MGCMIRVVDGCEEFWGMWGSRVIFWGGVICGFLPEMGRGRKVSWVWRVALRGCRMRIYGEEVVARAAGWG